MHNVSFVNNVLGLYQYLYFSGIRVAKTASKVVYFYGFVFITVNSLLVAFTYYVEDYAIKRSHLYIAIADSIPAYLTIFISVIARRHSTVECIYSASLRYCMSPPFMKSCALIFITVLFYFLVLICGFIFSLCFVDNNEHVFFILFHEFSFSPLFATCLLVSSLCLIAERVFIYINGQLREISKMRYPEKTISQIEILMFYHEVATDFVEETNSCFSYDLIALLLDFTHQLIFFSYTMTLLSQSNIISMLIMGLLYSVRLFKFLMVCSCSQRIHKQVI